MSEGVQQPLESYAVVMGQFPGTAERPAQPFARSGAEIHTIAVGRELAGMLGDALTAPMGPPAPSPA